MSTSSGSACAGWEEEDVRLAGPVAAVAAAREGDDVFGLAAVS
jgi:hypothetical protein